MQADDGTIYLSLVGTRAPQSGQRYISFLPQTTKSRFSRLCRYCRSSHCALFSAPPTERGVDNPVKTGLVSLLALLRLPTSVDVDVLNVSIPRRKGGKVIPVA